ncbi:phage tail protein [Pseudomonas otitidis]|uniref:phage tail protein n=1 Tax=Metapseudomonas otitidis TaxID=319939 RepID=UPI0024470394|nr:phage tail protein [Pseudomonas otitidis]MDG9783108.1 phage tail protein [Pseudomonas otitidis]MDI6524764.1 phage tail protein [Pseudomonas otitidis]
MAGYASFRLDVRGDDALLQRIGVAPEKLRRAIQLALNTVGRNASTLSWRLILEEINLRPSYIRNEVNFIPATPEELRVVIYARKRGVSLSQFPHTRIYKPGKRGKPVMAGVRVNVGHDWTELVEGAFIARMGPAGGLIAQRRGQERLPLDVLHGPSPSQVLGNKLDDLRERTRPELERELERQLERITL